MSSVIPPESGPLAALERILTAPEFAQADRLQQLLRFLAEKAIAGDTGAVKETVIGVEVFGRTPGYDPKIDSVVRTEVRRLRLKLQDYYAGSGAADTVRIEIPKGAYQVIFRSQARAAAGAPGTGSALGTPVEVPVSEAARSSAAALPAHAKPRALDLWIAASVLLTVALAAGFWLLRDAKPVRARIPVEPVLLTQSIGQATHPSLTADGSTVVYAFSEGTNSGIYLLRTDGQSAPRRLAGTRARDFNPVIHPDGTKVAFLREEGATQFGLMVQGVDDPEPKRWAAIDRRDRIAWVPDGKRMIVSMRLNPSGPASLVLISDSGLRTVVTSPPPGTLLDGAPVFSPDYRTLAFLRATESSVDEIHIVPIGTDFLPRATPRKLTNEKRRFAGFCFSPDGTSLIASLQRGRSVRALWRIPIDAPERMERLAETGMQAAYPTLAPRASRVVYSIGIDDLNLYGRYGNEAPKALSPSSTLDSSPAISPDGSQIAFRSARSGTSEIWVMRSDGAEPRRLTFVNGPVTGSPRWSPDGRYIAYDTRLDGHADIYIVTADGKTNRRLTWEPANEVVPSWSADGQFIYFATDASGTWEIWKIAADRSQPARQVTVAGGFRPIESPDARWLYYAKREPNSGLWRMPVGGGAEERVAPIPASVWGGWAVSSSGFYYLDPSARPPRIAYQGSASIPPVAIRNLPVLWEGSVAVSPDDRQLVFGQLDSAISDLYRVDLVP